MKVLLTSAPAVGHLVPLLGLGQALREDGHAVRVATHSDVHALIVGAGLEPVSAGMSGRAMTQQRVLQWPETVSRPGTEWAVRMFTTILAPTTLLDLLAFCGHWRPDLVIHEEGEYAGPVAASHVGVPWVTHSWGSPLRRVADLDSVEAHVGPLWKSVGLPVPRWGGLYQHGLLNPCPPSLQPDDPGVALSWAIRTEHLTGKAGSGVGHGPSDVYVGFGTVPLFAEDEAALAGAVGACVSRGLRTTVTTSDPAQAARLGALDPHLVTAGKFFDLGSVLPSCRLVVCHGGAGTVLAALGLGVPLVIVPKGTPSQTRMAAACVAAGVAVASDPAPDSLAAAIAHVLDQHAFRERAQEVARDIHAMPAAADVVPALVAVANSL